jgi:S1-C subfamily serine protease
LRAGDILLAIDGHEVHRSQDALAQLASRKPGTTVKLQLQRGQRVMQVELRLVERPNQA